MAYRNIEMRIVAPSLCLRGKIKIFCLITDAEMFMLMIDLILNREIFFIESQQKCALNLQL